MGIENPDNLPELYVDPQLGCEEELVLPKEIFPDLITAADMLTAMGVGDFFIAETDLKDPDGVRVFYKGDRSYTDFESLAHTYLQEINNNRHPLVAARIASLRYPKRPPKNQERL